MNLSDHGKKPYVVDIEELTENNDNFRTAVWTGEQLQMTLMSIEVGGDIGLEIHSENDQFLRVEAGVAKVQMGETKDNLIFKAIAKEDYGIFIPKGMWHNVTNINNEPLKLYSIYAPVHHKPGTVHQTRAEADAVEASEHTH